MIPLQLNWDGEGFSMKLIEEHNIIPPKEEQELPEICYKIADWWDGRKLQRVIVCAANRFELKDGGTLVIPGTRHYSKDMAEVVDAVADKLVTDHVCGDNQGFVDQWGEYFTREQALIIATNAGQINTRRTKGAPFDTRFSEDLY